MGHSEERYKFLIGTIPDILYSFSNKKFGIYYSPQVEEVLGYSAEHLINHPTLWHDSIHPDDAPAVDQAIQDATPGRKIEVEYRMHNAQGQWRWFYDRSVSITDEAGEKLITGLASDVTGKKQAEMQLRESEERLRAAARAANFGIYWYDFESGRIYYSPEFLALYGLPPGARLELNDNLIPKALHPDDRSGFLARMQAANAPCGSSILEHTYRIIRPDGQVIWLKVTGQTVYSGRQPGDRPLRANGIIQDITESKRLGEEQRKWEQQRQKVLFKASGFPSDPAGGNIAAEGNGPRHFLRTLPDDPGLIDTPYQ